MVGRDEILIGDPGKAEDEEREGLSGSLRRRRSNR